MKVTSLMLLAAGHTASQRSPQPMLGITTDALQDVSILTHELPQPTRSDHC